MHVLLKQNLYTSLIFSVHLSLPAVYSVWLKYEFYFWKNCDSFSKIRRVLCSSYFYCKKKKRKKKITGKMYFVRKLYFLSELDVQLNVLYSVRGLKIWLFIKTSWKENFVCAFWSGKFQRSSFLVCWFSPCPSSCRMKKVTPKNQKYPAKLRAHWRKYRRRGWSWARCMQPLSLDRNSS